MFMEDVLPSKKNGALHGKKIFVISADPSIVQAVKDSVASHGAVFFFGMTPPDAIGNVLAKNPDLIVYDEFMPAFNGSTVLSLLKQKRPKDKILYLTRTGVPLRSIDVTAQGVSFSIPRDSNTPQIYNAVKHCLAIASVPRVESPANVN
ncbi:MAG: DNA-binding response regulator [Candidatus Omnitrophota bacterium]|jgi:DNA-binding NarL/FixJ family response regulator|nr:MAG: DNA-binding response regulator [Candidatus Omnitrophota bacterium]